MTHPRRPGLPGLDDLAARIREAGARLQRAGIPGMTPTPRSADHEERQTDRHQAGDLVHLRAVQLLDALDGLFARTEPDEEVDARNAANRLRVLLSADRAERAAGASTITAEVATALDQLARAYLDGGPRPDVHRKILDRHRQEWPALWRALDRLLTTIGARS